MWQLHPYAVLILVATAISLGLVGFAWRQRPQVGATAFAVFMLGPSLWLAFHVCEVLATGLPAKSTFADLQWIGALLLPAGWIVFALDYSGREDWVGPGFVALLAVEPVVETLLLVVNDRYHLLWGPPQLTTVHLRALGGDTFQLVTADSAVGTYVHLLYTYVLLAVGSLILLGYVYRSHTLYRRQGIAIIAGVVVPWFASVIALVTALPFDMMLFGFLVSGATFAFAMSRYDLLDISPVARDAVIDNVTDSVVVLDRERRIVDINPQALRFVDAHESDVIGRSANEAFAEYGHIVERFEDVIRASEEVTIEVDGETRYFDLDLSPLRDRNDRTVGTILVGRDITDRRRREQKLREANERLEAFAGIVSHDLRNPLQVADARLGLASRECDSDHLDEIDQALGRMDDIIDDVLELTRADADAIDARPISVETAARDAWTTVETRDATLVVEADREVSADPTHLAHLFENLYRNAVEHGSTSPDSQARRDTDGASAVESSVADAPEDAVEHGSTSPQRADDAVEHGSTGGQHSVGSGDGITVTVGPLSDGTGFFVADDGPGIPEAERDEVFESGYSTSETGTGLGLSIVERIADVHGWTVGVTEGDAGGARFEFRTD